MSPSPHDTQVYIADIERLLKMEDMWAHRKPPRPLSWDELSAPAPVAEEAEAPKAADKDGEPAAPAAGENGKDGAEGKGKEDVRFSSQKKLSVRDSFALFVDACVPLPLALPRILLVDGLLTRLRSCAQRDSPLCALRPQGRPALVRQGRRRHARLCRRCGQPARRCV